MKSPRVSSLSRTLALIPPTVVLIAQQSTAASDVFLKIGDIKGESVDAEHREWIDAWSFQFGVSNPVTLSTGGSGAGKASFSDIVITKSLDSASPRLFLGCAKGTTYPTVTLKLVRAGEIRQTYYQITLSNVTISSVSNSNSEGDDRPSESVSLFYEKIKIEYWKTDAKGGLTPVAPVEWNVAENTGS